jgi:hypothetical protein
MSSVKLEPLISEFPEEADALLRLKTFVEQNQGGRREPIFPLERFFEIAEPSSQRILLGIMSRLVQQGAVKKVVRVESTAGGGIGDYDSLSEVPVAIFDNRQGHVVEIDPGQVRLMFKLVRGA